MTSTSIHSIFYPLSLNLKYVCYSLWFGWMGPLKIVWPNPACYGQGQPSLQHVAQSHIQSDLEGFQG